MVDATFDDGMVKSQAAWGAVLSMALCVAMLIASEFMPVSLLTPMAEGLRATEGQTGQAISISGLFAVAAGMFITTVAGTLNRKWVLVAMTATLEDNPSARDLVSMLPLHDLTIDNCANNEKIAYLPRKLAEEGSGPFGNERPGDLCYYAPWGNLAFFYAGYRWSQGLIRLGRIDGGFDPLLARGAFPLRIEIIE